MHGFSFLYFYPFQITFLLTSTGQTGKPISMVEGSNDAFPLKKVPFWDLIGKPPKSVRGLWFPSQTQ
jgi:hypothetical protein